jgi:hypothetical protein
MLSIHDEKLHIPPKHTVREIPKSDYITTTEFPEQDTDILNTVVELDYRLSTFYDSENELSPEDHEETYYKTGAFRVLRADKADPYVFIAISLDYKIMLVSSTLNISGTPIYANTVTSYPLQDDTYLGLETEDYYNSREAYNKGTIIAWSECEPTIGIIVEENNNNQFRLILDHEVTNKVISEDSNREYELDIVELRKNKLEGKTPYGIN